MKFEINFGKTSVMLQPFYNLYLSYFTLHYFYQ